MKNLAEEISRLSEEIITKKELGALFNSRKKLRIKYGVDVTSPFLHLGHAVNLWLMRAFQERGHKVIFLIGDFTTTIGDPTGRTASRPVIAEKDIKKGAKEFIKQVSKILLTDKKVFEIRKNSEWFAKMKAKDLIGLMSLVTNSQLIRRDMFRKRIGGGGEIYEHEVIYPLLQGYDSVMVEADLTIIGSDQLFNEMMGRILQEKFKKVPQTIITTKITPGIGGGAKQSKSSGNYIALEDSAREKFGKVMSIPDDLIIKYFEVYSDVPLSQIKEIEQGLQKNKFNPKDAKMKLAEAIVSKYHSKKETSDARKFFVETFQKRKLPKSLPTIKLRSGELFRNILAIKGFALSNSEAARLIKAGAVEFDGVRLRDIHEKITKDGILRVGKKRFVRIEIK